jgi:5-methylcytosine-specific restriction endonuclease McrA
MDKNRKREIYDRTGGYCHICGKKVYFTNYGKFGERGAWEVEHSNARANGGTDRLNNLYAACISCNRAKGVQSTQSARAPHGRTSAPPAAMVRRATKKKKKLIGNIVWGTVAVVCAVAGIRSVGRTA